MFNKKRIFVLFVFILLLFFLMTFGSGGTPTRSYRTVTFIDGYNGTVLSVQEIEVGSDATVPSTPKHIGNEFVGWFDESDEDREVTDFTNILEDLTVIGKYEGKYYTVIFYDTIAKEVIKTQKVLEGGNATAPKVPSHDSYTFDGWSRGYTNVRSDIQVDALYSRDIVYNYYTVTFIDNVDKTTIKEQTVREGLSATFPSIPYHKNMVYSHYEGDYTNVTEDRVVTLFFKDAIKYTVTFDKGEHGILNSTFEKVTFSVFVDNTFEEGKVLTPKVTPIDGYTFDKWDTEFSKDTVVTKDMLITALYTPNTDTKYTVEHYKVKNGVEASTPFKTERLTGTTDALVSATPAYAKGYSFDAEYVKTVKSGIILGNGSLVLRLYYIANEYELTVNYVMSDNTTAPKSYNDTLLAEDSYSVDSPEVVGYHADKTTVSGVIEDHDVVETVTYSPNTNTKYTVEHYTKNLGEGYTKVDTDELTGTTNTEATYASKAYTGFTYNEELTTPVDKKIKADGSLVIKLYYDRNSYKLTVDYQTTDGSEAPRDVVKTLKYEEAYSITSPEVVGYKADILVVSGNMPAKDLAVVVKYSPNADTKYTVEHYTKNLGEGYTKVNTEDLTGTTNTEATYAPKTYTGFTYNEELTTPVDKKIKADGSLVIKLYYDRNSYKLTVDYQTTDGSEAPRDVVKTLKYEETYSITSPEVVGYKADILVVSGNMPAEDKTVVVKYSPNTNTKYTVVHHIEKLVGGYEVKDTENLTGTTNTEATYASKTYTGFTYNEELTTPVDKKIKADGSLVIDLYYKRNSYKLTVDYQTTDRSEAPTDVVKTLKYEETYSITSPEVVGYKADILVVSGNMPAKDLIVVVKYSPNTNTKYTVEHYTKNLGEGYTKVDTEDLTGTTNTEATYAPKTYTGFTYNEELTTPVDKKIKADGSLVIKLYYDRNSYKLTVDYQTTDGSEAPRDVVKTLKYEETYSITSPEVVGYKANILVVSGNMPAKDLTVVVKYSPNTNTKYTVEHYTKNLGEGYTKVDTDELTGTTNTEATYASKAYTGFTYNEELTTPVDKKIKADGSLVIKLYYDRNSYKLTVDYQTTDGSEAPRDVVKTLKYEEAYSITSPKVDGYTASQTLVSGLMPAKDLTIIVIYSPNSGISYKVEHYTMNLGEGYTKVNTEDLTGTTNTEATYAPKTYTGFTYNEELTTPVDKKIKADGSLVIKLYYDRNSYKLTVDYQTTDGSEAPRDVVKTVKYADNYKVVSPNVEGYNVDIAEVSGNMPAKDLIVIVKYSPRTDLSYTVEYRENTVTGTKLDDDKLVSNVTFGETYTEVPNMIAGYDPIDSFKTIKIAITGNKIIFVYTARTDLSYTVEYRKDTVTGTKLADDKLVSDVTFDETYTEEPIEIEGYVKPTGSKSVTIAVSDNKIVFIYTARTDLSYTVEYRKDTVTGTKLADDKLVSNVTFGETYTENAIEIEGYVKPTESKSVTIAVSDNKIVFIYTARTDLSYTVEYRENTVTGTKLADDKLVSNVTFGETYTENAIEIEGYVKPTESKSVTIAVSDNKIVFIYTARTDLSYTVEYRENTVTGTKLADDKLVSNVTFGETYTEEPIEIEGYVKPLVSKYITIAVSDNKIIFVYTARTDLSYTVEYRKDTVTGTKLADDKLVSNVTFDETYTEEPIEIEGYVKPTGSKSVTIAVSDNKIIFVYTARTDLSYTVEYRKDTVTGTKLADDKLVSNVTFGETYTENAIEIEGYVKPTESKSVTIAVSDNKIVFIYTARTDLSYTVEYRENTVTGTKLADDKLVSNVTFGETYTENALNITGYTSTTATKSVVIALTNNKIIFIYNINSYDYTVEYYLDNVLDSTRTVTGEADYGTTINSSKYEIDITNYNFIKSNPTSIVISDVESNNVIKVYYEVKKPNISASVTKNITRNGENVTDGVAEYGDVITYSLTVKNTGDAVGTVNLKDMKFANEMNVENTVSLITEGLSVQEKAEITDLLSSGGLNVTLNPDGTKTITFSVKVIGNAGEDIISETTYSVEGGEEKTTGKVTFTIEKKVKYIEKTETITGTNIVIVIDKSASMDNSKIINAKNAAKTFVDSIFTSSSNSNNSVVSVITFGTNYECTYGYCRHVPYTNVIGSANSYASASTLKSNIDLILNSTESRYGSGTPYGVALQRSYNILYNTTNGLYKNGNKNVMIFLSDGEPSSDDVNLRNTYISNFNSSDATVYSIGYDVQKNSNAHKMLNNVSGSSSRTYLSGINGLIEVFDAINENIQNIGDTVRTSKGVAQISNTIIADASHPITISVNGTVTSANTFTSVEAALSSGKIIHDDVCDCYELDATKFNASDVLEVAYFVDLDQSNKTSLKSLSRGIVNGKAILSSESDEMTFDEVKEETPVVEIETSEVEEILTDETPVEEISTDETPVEEIPNEEVETTIPTVETPVVETETPTVKEEEEKPTETVETTHVVTTIPTVKEEEETPLTEEDNE